MAKCYTCQKDIIFSDDVVSKTGKKIPLWPDGKNTHGHDDDGNPIRGDLPYQSRTTTYKDDTKNTTGYITAGKPTQINQYRREPGTPTDVPKYSQGGPALDTKRILQAVLELTTEIREFRKEMQENKIIDGKLYDNHTSRLYEVIYPFMNTQKTALDLMNENTKAMEEINHSKIADDAQAFLQSKRDRIRNPTKFVDESREKTLDERIPDSDDDFAISETLKEDDENEGVVTED